MAKKKVAPPLPFRILFAVFPIIETWIPSLAKFIIVRLFFTPFRFKPRPDEESLTKLAHEFSLNINGNTIYGRKWNEGPIAILVHGWSGRGMQLRHFIEPLLDKGYSVITFDAPGHGRSEGKESSLLEIKDSLFAIQEKYGDFKLAIGHSLGGASLMYSIKEGLKVEQLVSVSTPVVPHLIINEFLRRINASQKMAGAINEYVVKRTGNTFEHYSGVYNLANIHNTPLLAFHDEDDKEAEIDHIHALKKAHLSAEIVITQGQGHNRILKNKAVIERISRLAGEIM